MEKYRIDRSKGIEFGLYTLGDHIPNPETMERISAKQRLDEIIELAKLAEEFGLDVFSVGESHQKYFATQAHSVVLSAIAQATKNIKLTSSSTIISTSDPVRVYEDFSTIDLISNGRVEIVAGRASRVGLFELLGYDLKDYEGLFEEKFELLKLINENKIVNWEGEYRAPLKNAEVLPRPLHNKLPLWRAVGGAPGSAIRAGKQGVPMMLATLGGPSSNFKIAVDAYRKSLSDSGFDPAEFPVATTGLFFTDKDSQVAMRQAYPGVNLGLQLVNGSGFSKQHFAQAQDVRDALMVGSPQQIIEKILYQYELFGHQRYMAQMDFGGVPFPLLVKNLELIASEILPAVRKYTKQ